MTKRVQKEQNAAGREPLTSIRPETEPERNDEKSFLPWRWGIFVPQIPYLVLKPRAYRSLPHRRRAGPVRSPPFRIIELLLFSPCWMIFPLLQPHKVSDAAQDLVPPVGEVKEFRPGPPDFLQNSEDFARLATSNPWQGSSAMSRAGPLTMARARRIIRLCPKDN